MTTYVTKKGVELYPGQECPWCAEKGESNEYSFMRRKPGSLVCGYCGKTVNSFSVIPFDLLEIGDLFVTPYDDLPCPVYKKTEPGVNPDWVSANATNTITGRWSSFAWGAPVILVSKPGEYNEP